mmetsp:Transcript_22105/g.51961  ORF Transcript_22105/g.51961 Transcript_22105/m.51961 type:complete len:208 (-) Transcript_22105:327-950(-)
MLSSSLEYARCCSCSARNVASFPGCRSFSGVSIVTSGSVLSSAPLRGFLGVTVAVTTAGPSLSTCRMRRAVAWLKRSCSVFSNLLQTPASRAMPRASSSEAVAKQEWLRSSGLAITIEPLRKLSMCIITADRLASKSAIGSANCPSAKVQGVSSEDTLATRGRCWKNTQAADSGRFGSTKNLTTDACPNTFLPFNSAIDGHIPWPCH